ncbi:MAG: hypothetical protein Unbinned5123contig1000_35 [Prokaryotic dsDNA virus sp.]|nr:MAG: hypothetical protein Unbinned5123contig1000_35 [Prokaryotic dsDNA virus sp.]|tara:strand:- start:22825 stop:22980 length:156 start_codon:yes stop_codon:yes gene_type:complete
MSIIEIQKSENGFLVVLLSLIGFGLTYGQDNSVTLTFKLFKLHMMLTFAVM